MSLRDHWSYEPKIGDLYAARVDCSKEMTAEIEQIGSPVKANLYDILRGVSASGKNEETSILTAYNHFLKKCEKRFSKVGIYRPQFHGFQVIGTKLDLDIAKPDEENVQQKEAVENAQHRQSKDSTQVQEYKPANAFETGLHAEDLKTSLNTYRVCGPAAELDNSNLFFSGKPGELLNSRVTLQNQGSTILYYKWMRQPSGSVLKTARKDRGEYFEIMPRAGYIEPGETEVFYISFYPRFAGVFTQSWVLDFSPKLLTPLKSIKLLGIAIEEFGNSAQRKLLAHRLEVKQRNRGLEEVFSEMIDNALKRAPLTFMKKIPGFILSAENYTFLRSNECYETPLYYNPRLVQQCEKLALEIASSDCKTSTLELDTGTEHNTTNDLAVEAYNFSVSSFVLFVRDGVHKEEQQKKVHNLLHMMALPPHPSSILFTAMHKSIVNMINRMQEVLEHMKMLEEAERMVGNLDNDELSEKDGVSDYEEGGDDALDLVGSKMYKKAKYDVKLLLQEMIEHFFVGTEDAVRRVEPLVQEMIQSSMAKEDTESTAWINFWHQRLLHALGQ